MSVVLWTVYVTEKKVESGWKLRTRERRVVSAPVGSHPNQIAHARRRICLLGLIEALCVPSHQLLHSGKRWLPASVCPAHSDAAPLPVPAPVPAAGGWPALCP